MCYRYQLWSFQSNLHDICWFQILFLGVKIWSHSQFMITFSCAWVTSSFSLGYDVITSRGLVEPLICFSWLKDQMAGARGVWLNAAFAFSQLSMRRDFVAFTVPINASTRASKFWVPPPRSVHIGWMYINIYIFSFLY